MTTGCVTQTNYTSGAQLTGLTAGTSYFVTITAVPPAGFVVGDLGRLRLRGARDHPAHRADRRLLAYGTVAGSIAVTFTGSSNAAGRPDVHRDRLHQRGMTTGCVTDATHLGRQPDGPRLRRRAPRAPATT